VNKQEFSASSWRSNQGYTKMHGQPIIKTHFSVYRSQWFPSLPPCKNLKNSCSYPEEPLPMKTFAGQETKTMLVAHGDYSSIANYRTDSRDISMPI